MIEVKDLLGRWGDILLSAEGKKEIIRKAVWEATNLDVAPEKIQIKNGDVFLDIKPIYKNEIFLRREKIFEKLGEILGKKSPRNIR